MLVEMSSNAACIKVGIGKCFSDVCPILFGLEEEDSSSLFPFKSAVVYTIR